MKTITFDYDSVDGKSLEILAEIEDGQIHFKAFEGEKRIPNSKLTTLDFKNIQDFIGINAEEDIDNESDYLDRQSD